MKYINNFINFIFESEEFTKENYLNWKEYNRKRGISPTEEERESYNKYQRIRKKGLDPIAPFRKKEEEFTKEDYLNWKEYNRKRGISPTEEERESFNKYNRIRSKGLDPIAPFRKKEEEEFTKEDYLNWKEFNRKKGISPTEEERESYNKYQKIRSKGLDPIAPFRKKEEEFTKEDYLNWKEYKRKRGISLTEEERESYNKYQRIRSKGLDPIAPFRKKEEEEEEFTKEDYLNWKEYHRKENSKPKLTPTEEERESFNEYNRLRAKGLDPIAPFRKKEEEFTKEDYLNWKEYNRKRGISPTEEERESYNKYQRIKKIGLDPIAPFRKKEEEFTKEDYLNWKEYNRKRGISPTEEERESYNKYYRLRSKGLDPSAPFRKKEEEFTKEDYLNWKEYLRKKKNLSNYKPTEEERESYNKYIRNKKIGLDPIAPFKKTNQEKDYKKIYK